MINSFHSSGNSSLFQIEIISFWVAQLIFLPPALINCAGICSKPDDLWLYIFSMANSTSKALGLGTSSSSVCISACLTSLAPCRWEKLFLYIITIVRESENKSPLSSFTTIFLGWYPLLKSLIPQCKSLILLPLLLVSSSSILPFSYAFFLFLKCLLPSRAT
jgi:hypothetical protein